MALPCGDTGHGFVHPIAHGSTTVRRIAAQCILYCDECLWLDILGKKARSAASEGHLVNKNRVDHQPHYILWWLGGTVFFAPVFYAIKRALVGCLCILNRLGRHVAAGPQKSGELDIFKRIQPICRTAVVL